MSDPHRMLVDHRRALWWSLALLACGVAALFVVGRHPTALAPMTTVPFVGRFDLRMHDWMLNIRNDPLTALSKVLNVVGGGAVTIPVRIVAVLVLAFRRRWARCIAFALTWALSELALTWLKVYFHRGRPPDPLVLTAGTYSFPSGHAVAAAATGVALVIAFFPAGARRRRWEWLAAGFAFVMAMSRVYLAAHWFSDVVAGTLLGAGIAVFSAAVVTECRDLILRARGEPVPNRGGPPAEPQVAK